MSRHSHWAKIKHAKGSADVARGNLFTKLSNAITIAVREGGGGDPSFNFRLRLAIEAAKTESMPRDNIDRAIARGLGTDEGTTLEEIVYEGFGPGNVPLLIVTVTDNRNRAAQEVKQTMNKNGGMLVGPGSVAWQFEKKGSLYLKIADNKKLASRNEAELALIEAGTQDLGWDSEGVTVYIGPTDLKNVETTLTTAGFKIKEAGFEYVPKQKVTLKDEDKLKLEALLAELEAVDDVQDVAVAAEM